MPAPHEIPAGLEVLVVDHPLATSRLSIMQDVRTDNATFRAALRDLTMMLVYEASRNLTTELIPIDTPVAATSAVRSANPPSRPDDTPRLVADAQPHPTAGHSIGNGRCLTRYRLLASAPGGP